MKKRHNKTSDDAKFQGTILGKPSEVGEIEIEIEGGGGVKSISDWIALRSGPPPPGEGSPQVNGSGEQHSASSSPSSGLSSVGDRLDQNDDDDMDLT